MEITLEGKTHQVSEGATGFDLFDNRDIIALRVNGELKDLAYPLNESDVVVGIDIRSRDGLDILRHSTAHLLAQAVQDLFDKAKLGIGPPIEDGFYYDFDVEEPFTPEDLKKLEKRMKELVGKSQRFVRVEVSDSEAKQQLANEPYKLELIDLKSSDVGEGSVEVGAGGLSIYQNQNPDGSIAWYDLCRGPHIPNSRMVG
ncbi:MAG: threonine--tRNA ligase, partial [Aquiluna sp.]